VPRKFADIVFTKCGMGDRRQGKQKKATEGKGKQQKVRKSLFPKLSAAFRGFQLRSVAGKMYN